MYDVIEPGCNPADEVYATQDDFGATTTTIVEPFVDELPFEIPRD